MLHLRQQQKLLQKLSPQQIQLMKLLQVPTMLLDQRIKQEIEENPALEEGEDADEAEAPEQDIDAQEEEDQDNETEQDEFSLEDYIGDDDEIPDYKLQANNTSPDDDRREIPLISTNSDQDVLINQLGQGNFTEKQYQIGLTIIGNIDESGYLERDLKAMVDDLAFSQNIQTTLVEVEEVLAMVQDFDPPGIAARSLQECLLIQLKRIQQEENSPAIAIAIRILGQFFDDFTKKHFDKIMDRLDIEEEELREAMDEILRLNPKPGSAIASTTKTVQYIIPDFTIRTNEGELELTLNARNAPDLRLSKQYKDMLSSYSRGKQDSDKKQAVAFIKQKIESAKWFIDAIKQRQNTLLVTMDAIMTYQKEYFLEGDETKLRPMILKDIAEMIGMDISTISRVSNSKYVETPFGTFLLKDLFSESLSTDSGEEVSTREVKKILQDCIAAESKKSPLPDEKLTEILTEKGYHLARRTVAKYREQLGIPVARMRKEL